MFLPNIINTCLALKQGLTKQVCKRLHSRLFIRCLLNSLIGWRGLVVTHWSPSL